MSSVRLVQSNSHPLEHSCTICHQPIEDTVHWDNRGWSHEKCFEKISAGNFHLAQCIKKHFPNNVRYQKQAEKLAWDTINKDGVLSAMILGQAGDDKIVELFKEILPVIESYAKRLESLGLVYNYEWGIEYSDRAKL